MKAKSYFAAGLFLLMTLGVAAQNLTVQSSDASEWPLIRVSVNVSVTDPVQADDFKVYEEQKEVPCTAAAGQSTGEGPRAVCFLIEASGYTFGAPLEQFKKAVSSALQDLRPGDVVNICYFGKANTDGKTMNTISAEFTSDISILKSEMNGKIRAVRDTNRIADVFKGIYECLDFMTSKKDLPGEKLLIVLSAAINNSKSPIRADDCIEKAIKDQIPVYTITYKTNNRYAADHFIRISDKTNASSESARSEAEIARAIGNFLGEKGTRDPQTGQPWVITFTSGLDDKLNNFVIEYKGEKINASYELTEGGENFLTKYWWIIVAGVVLIAAIFTVLILISRKSRKARAEGQQKLRELEEKNIRLREKMRQDDHQKTRIGTDEAKKFDLKKTMIGGGGGSPVIMVSCGSFSKNVTINKMQMSIGRNPGNDVVIPDQTVSGTHAVIANEGGFWYIVDQNSTNGTLVNGIRVTRHKLGTNDLIKLGAASLKIQF